MDRVISIIRRVSTVLAIAMSLYHLYTAAMGLPEAMLHRSIHILFTLVLIFLFEITRRSAKEKARNLWDALLILVVLAALGHIFINYEYVIDRYPYVHPLTRRDYWLGIAFTLVLLEAARRRIGWALPLTASAFLLYGIFGHLLPDLIQFYSVWHLSFQLPGR